MKWKMFLIWICITIIRTHQPLYRRAIIRRTNTRGGCGIITEVSTRMKMMKGAPTKGAKYTPSDSTVASKCFSGTRHFLFIQIMPLLVLPEQSHRLSTCSSEPILAPQRSATLPNPLPRMWILALRQFFLAACSASLRVSFFIKWLLPNSATKSCKTAYSILFMRKRPHQASPSKMLI